MAKINSQFNSQGIKTGITIISFCVCALFCALFFEHVLLYQALMVMACGKPSGNFSHNPAEGYRIPYPTKITQNPCIQKKGYSQWQKEGLPSKSKNIGSESCLGSSLFLGTLQKSSSMNLLKSGLNYRSPRWLIDYSVRQHFIAAYHEPNLGFKVYYLTQRGQGFLHRYEPFSSHYRFNNRHTGFNTFEHQKAVIESYRILYKQLAIKEWVPEWVIRKKLRARLKIPDALMVLNSGLKIALEVETWYKQRDELKVVVYKYRREMKYGFYDSSYHVVLLIAYSSSNYEGIKNRLFYIEPEFSKKAFMLADLVLLERGECFYQDEVRQIKEALNLISQQFNDQKKQ